MIKEKSLSIRYNRNNYDVNVVKYGYTIESYNVPETEGFAKILEIAKTEKLWCQLDLECCFHREVKEAQVSDDYECPHVHLILDCFNNSNFTSFAASFNNIGNTGAQLLAKHLINHKSLKRMYMGYNKIGDAGIIEIANLITNHTGLDTIDVRDNDMTEIGANALANALNTSKSIYNLDCFPAIDLSINAENILCKAYILSHSRVSVPWWLLKNTEFILDDVLKIDFVRVCNKITQWKGKTDAEDEETVESRLAKQLLIKIRVWFIRRTMILFSKKYKHVSTDCLKIISEYI